MQVPFSSLMGVAVAGDDAEAAPFSVLLCLASSYSCSFFTLLSSLNHTLIELVVTFLVDGACCC